MTFTKSLTALSAVILLAGCGDINRQSEAENSAETALTFQIEPCLEEEEGGAMTFRNMARANQWVKKYPDRITVTGLAPQKRSDLNGRVHLTGNYLVYYTCKKHKE